MAEVLHKELSSHGYQAYQMLRSKVELQCSTRSRSDNLPEDREDLLRFISYRCNVVEHPDLEEAHCDKTFAPDGKNDFVGLLADRLNECVYTVSIAEDCPPLILQSR
ncbi:9298_t:CDS:2 [Paraglomus occultum]|uniref:9298_t:CDS:1 n=1 Tax=Paraglomus occultum TaxID=144539 RepID=A0A9N9CTG7_9GLOM|nr:9298_t:CDS:2 [Paraglomus occultum]